MDEQKKVVPAEDVAVEEKTSKKNKNKKSFNLKGFLRSNRFKKGSLATAFTAGFIVIVILINVFFSALEDRFPSMKIDMTENKIYSLSETVLEAAEKIDIPTTIYVLAKEDTAKDDSILASYGLQYSQIPVLCEKMEEANSNITVKYVDLDTNPTFASQTKYANYSLQTGSVIIENDRRIRVLSITDFFTMQYDENYVATYYMSIDSALTGALMQVQADEIPVISIATGSHGELLSAYLETFETLFQNNNFEIKKFDILTQDIPDDTAILLLPTPTSDYTDAELSKLDTFLASNEKGFNSLWLTFDPAQPELPNLSSFLSEWGFAVPNEIIIETDAANLISVNGTFFISQLTDNLDIGSSHASMSEYGYFVTPTARPIELLYEYSADNNTYPISVSSSTAYVQDSSAEAIEEPTGALSSYVTTALSQRVVKISDEDYMKSVVVFGSSAMFTSSYLSSTTFANAEYLVDLARFTLGIADAKIGVTQEFTAVNTFDITITTAARNFFGIGVFTIMIPLAIVIAGLVVYLKRRHL